MKKILILALAVYLIISPLTFHPDTKLVLYYGTLNKGAVWDIYTYLNTHHDDAPKFHYPPMNFWMVKAELIIVNLASGKDIDSWLKIGANQAFEDNRIFLYNLATKLPLILLVVLTGWMIGQIMIKNGYKEKAATAAMLIWFFNPITIYSAVMMGQNDILAICPFIIGLYFYFDRPWLAFLLFGWGGSIKSFPLIWAGMLALAYPDKNLVQKSGYLLAAVAVYAITMLPFLHWDYFRQDVLFSGLSMRMFENKIHLFGSYSVPVTLIILGILGILVLLNKNKTDLKKLAVLLVATNLIVLGFSIFNPQWMIWIMPFAAIAGIGKKSWWFPVLLMAWVGIIMFFNDKFLVWGILTPINPSLINLPTINDFLTGKLLPINLINNICHYIVALLAIYWSYKYVKE